VRSHTSPQALRRWQRGATAVEFALVAAFGGLFILLIGVFELGRARYVMSSANEATTLGARVAIVCGKDDSRILQRMRQVMPTLAESDVQIGYTPTGCSESSNTGGTPCVSATVTIRSGLKIKTVIPFLPPEIPLPAFTTTLTREAMDSASCG
jgi:Flp pilus assembly protein TadG